MPGLEQHGQHLAPQVHGAGLAGGDFAARGAGLALGVGALKLRPAFVVQVGGVAGRKQSPFRVRQNPLHEEVGNPIGGVHVVRAAALVAGVLAQIQKRLNVHVPGFQIAAGGALALAALVDGYGGVVDDFQKGNHPLRLAVGPLDARAHGAHRRPVVAEAAGEFRQQGVFLIGLKDALQVVRDGGEVAAGELRPHGAGVEQGGRGGHEAERGQQVVEFRGALGGALFARGQPHGDAHEEHLRHFHRLVVHAQEVAVVEGLQADVAELQVALRADGAAEFVQVEFAQEVGVDEFGVGGAGQAVA